MAESNDPATDTAILAGLRSLLATPAANVAHAEELAPLLTATKARAVGCWRHDRGSLRLAGFLAVDDMPLVVQAEFVAATRDVPLSQTQFGIVQAVAANGPAINHRSTDADEAVAGSIGWLARLEAGSSLAIPLHRGTDLIGAVATATADRIEPGDVVWRLMTALRERVEARSASRRG